MCIKFLKLHKNKASSTVYSLITMLFASVVFLLSYKVYLSIDEHIISIKYIGYKYYLQDDNIERNNFVEIEIKHVNNNLILIPKSKCEKIYNF